MKRLGVVAFAVPLACAALLLSACDDTATDVTPGGGSSTSGPTGSSSPSTSSSDGSTATDSGSPNYDVLITMAQPTDGETVTSGTLDVSGTANSPEANVPWKIEDAKGSLIDSGFFTADGWMDKLYPYSGTIDVSSYEPGTYTLTVQVDDLSDGEGVAPQQVQRNFVIPSASS